jgi:hypothetical protein
MRMRLFLTFVYGAACMTIGAVVWRAEPCEPAICDRNHVTYDSQGRPEFTEWCDKENGRCYVIIDGKQVMQKYKCKKQHD